MKGIERHFVKSVKPTWFFRYRARCSCGYGVKRWNAKDAEQALDDHISEKKGKS